MPPLTSRHPSLLSSGLSRGQATSLRSALPDQLEAWAVCRPGILASQSALRAGVSLPAAGPAGVGEGPDPPAPSAQNQLDTQRPLVTESVKRAVVNTARDSWEVYFSRLFPATVRALPARPAPSPASPPCRARAQGEADGLVPAGQRGHGRADPRCGPHGHQAPADGQGQPGGQRAAACPAHVQVRAAGTGSLGTGTDRLLPSSPALPSRSRSTSTVPALNSSPFRDGTWAQRGAWLRHS